MHERLVRDVSKGMSAVQQRIHHHHTAAGRDRRATADGTFDWAGQVKLAVVLSIVAVIVTVGLAGRVADQLLVVGLIAVASVLSWRRVDFGPRARTAPVRVRHR